ncbi:synaptotagmin-like protein 2 isoform X2 [Fopius arisanus]|uniref:Synaptotagmin-like protein 2 isoform X2 n=1 Tax=Fopius arisanus TaxID=64838 RepID=A0A0C9R0U3_9HYME|nr:PREDICTED: synaptotagmin-like protein 2 isoform X2 [Fopius arisanus]
MGQAWCKERSNKAQDSKSPLDRVFLRCAHRIYPSLKEEGSVLGGATQRVTSSEIGYAGSPSRELLTRGCSIDSVDRPFQPSDWVDVNLEVPSTPRASSVMTNRTLDTTLYHTASPTTSYSNLKDVTPIPPPRSKKKNRRRPLPPKPSESYESLETEIAPKDSKEPLYSSVKFPTGKKKEIYEIERVIPNAVVSGWKSAERLSSHEKTSIKSKSSSTVSLPNYNQLEASRYEDEDEKSSEEKQTSPLDQFTDLPVDGLRLDKGKTSTPLKQDIKDEPRTPVKVDGWFLHPDKGTRFEDSPAPEENGTIDEETMENRSFTKNTYENPFFEIPVDEMKKTHSLNRHREVQSTKNLRRSLSNDTELFDNFEDRNTLALRVDPSSPSQSDSSPRVLTRSISEESFPSALMEDPDEIDFFEDKVVKDTKNEITKIREELEAVKNEVKTPPSSPEPKIKPELQSNDHSTLLKVLRDEADDSNLSSMTPSLTELSAALSDMLEKQDEHLEVHEQPLEYKHIPEKSIEIPIEPKIIPLIVEETPPEMVNIDLTNGNAINGFEKINKTNHDIESPPKPSRLHRIIQTPSPESPDNIPTPPRRRNRSSSGALNDRLI